MAYSKGTDWSHWQGDSDVLKAISNGVVFFFFKATQGTSLVDSKFANFRRQAEDAGVPWGPYHFFQANIDPIAQARHFYNTVGDYTGLPPVVDFELTYNQTKYTINLRLRQFVDEVTRLFGVKPIIYTRAYFWNYWIYRAGDWKDYILWVAHYTTGSPMIPLDWNDWEFHQYTSKGDGPAHGTTSLNVDLNNSVYTKQELEALAGIDQPPPPPPPVNERYFEAYVYASALRVRAGHNLSAPTVRFLSHGDKVKVYGTEYDSASNLSWGKISDTEEEWTALKWVTMTSP